MHGYHDHTYLKGNSQFSRHKRHSTILILEIKERLRKPLLSNRMRYIRQMDFNVSRDCSRDSRK